LDKQIIIQTGKSEYVPIYCKYFAFVKDLSKYIEEASLVVSHGGAGTCYEILKLGKKLIGVENKKVHDAHQWDLLNKLEEEGYIIWCREINNLEHDIRRAFNHDFKRYTSPPCNMPKIINNFLNGKK
jgi:beta-1,4-N-acetylglucosaminyltransferase